MRQVGILAAIGFVAAGVSFGLISQAAPAGPPKDGRVAVVFSGGHDTDSRDRGRPVILIASALGVPAQVFRDAFTHVHPAQGGGGPTREEAQANKRALMDALAPYGVTNERLDEVSNFYRYRREAGEMWPTTDATAVAIVKDGKVTGYEVTSGGSGYSSPPVVSVPGLDNAKAEVSLTFGKDFDSNGAVKSIATIPAGH